MKTRKIIYTIITALTIGITALTVNNSSNNVPNNDTAQETVLDNGIRDLTKGYTSLMMAIKMDDNQYVLTDFEGDFILVLGVQYEDGKNYYVDFNGNRDMIDIVATDDDFKTVVDAEFEQEERDLIKEYYGY